MCDTVVDRSRVGRDLRIETRAERHGATGAYQLEAEAHQLRRPDHLAPVDPVFVLRVDAGMREQGVPAVGILDDAAVQHQRVTPDPDPVVVPVGGLHLVLEHQRGGAGTARVAEVLFGSGSVGVLVLELHLDVGRTAGRGNLHVCVERHADLDDLVHAIGVVGRQRRGGDLHAKRALVVDDGHLRTAPTAGAIGSVALNHGSHRGEIGRGELDPKRLLPFRVAVIEQRQIDRLGCHQSAVRFGEVGRLEGHALGGEVVVAARRGVVVAGCLDGQGERIR